jgi:hypothetical protein
MLHQDTHGRVTILAQALTTVVAAQIKADNATYLNMMKRKRKM